MSLEFKFTERNNIRLEGKSFKQNVKGILAKVCSSFEYSEMLRILFKVVFICLEFLQGYNAFCEEFGIKFEIGINKFVLLT